MNPIKTELRIILGPSITDQPKVLISIRWNVVTYLEPFINTSIISTIPSI